jgi:hypothetical protein
MKATLAVGPATTATFQRLTPAFASRRNLEDWPGCTSAAHASAARNGDGGSIWRLVALQRTVGNAAVHCAIQRQDDEGSDSDEMPFPMDQLTVEGEPDDVEMEGGCDGLALHGQANATYDGGRGHVTNQKVTTSNACTACSDQPCLHVTGTLATTYSASVTITMPPMPDGLSPCEQGKVREFLTNVLLPHEKEHERRFKTYNGTTQNPIDVTGCGRADIQAQITAIQTSEDQQRQTGANALSGAIDPFTDTIDCSDCDDE